MAQLKDLIVTGASRFLGNIYGTLKGNADTATKATYDSAGQPINTTYIKGLSVSGKTITYTKGNGTTGTITTQDTTYPNATTSAPGLMSKDDKAKLDAITASADAVSFSRSLASGTKVGTITINGTGTDLYAPTNTDTKNTAGSTDTSSKIYLIGATSQAANLQTYSHDTAYVGTDGCLYSNNTKVSVEGHTHNYAGSSSAGGAANSANKLATARTFRTNLGSTSTASFDGSADVTPGVTGTLGLANGGTGATTAAAARSNLGAASRASYTATITTNWTGSSAPYTQAVTVSGILTTDCPHIVPVYSSTLSTALEQKEAWSMVSKAETSANTITFTCFEEKPMTAIPIQIEVIR